jgi:hypothetical protein
MARLGDGVLDEAWMRLLGLADSQDRLGQQLDPERRKQLTQLTQRRGCRNGTPC